MEKFDDEDNYGVFNPPEGIKKYPEQCPKCLGPSLDNSEICPNCGIDFNDLEPEKSESDAQNKISQQDQNDDNVPLSDIEAGGDEGL